MSDKNKDTGGPAFPVPLNDGEAWVCRQGDGLGMTLRDWFAGMAMQGMYANQSFDNWGVGDVAVTAYDQADAMLELRKGKADE